MKGYINRHLAMEKYSEKNSDAVYTNRNGWQDFLVGEQIVFSHRTSEYTDENFPEHLHSHDYCELLFWERGEVQYLCGDREIAAREGCVVMIPPEKSHTARLVSSSTYERFVLYFKPSAFDFCGKRTGLGEFFASERESFAFCLPPHRRDEVRAHLESIEATLRRGSEEAQLLAYAEIGLLLHLLKKELGSASDEIRLNGEALSEQVRELRDFLNESYATIGSVDEVAARFYYSREYVTRLFRRYFNLSPWKYVEQLRVREACARLNAGEKVTEVCYAVGYHSMSAFSAAFHRVMGVSPTQYRRKK